MSDKPIARRYNKGKLMYNLISPIALAKLADVYTKGCEKYTVYNEDGSIKESGANNWKNGLPFTQIMDSCKRHIQAWESGEDIDKDLQSSHLANAAWNLFTILHLTETKPEFDSRDLWYKKPFKKVWLDLDGVIFDFERDYLLAQKVYGDNPSHPTDWNDFRFREPIVDVYKDQDFWELLSPLVKAEDLKYPIAGYCTSREHCNDITIAESLHRNGFPSAKIINTKGEPKSKFLLEEGCDIMVDDSISNFVDCQSNGIQCYLMSRPHNIKYNVGHWRINNLQELWDKLMS